MIVGQTNDRSDRQHVGQNRDMISLHPDDVEPQPANYRLKEYIIPHYNTHKIHEPKILPGLRGFPHRMMTTPMYMVG